MGRTEKRRCLSCGESFTAEARNARHQRYCPALPCKAASKRASQAKPRTLGWNTHLEPPA